MNDSIITKIEPQKDMVLLATFADGEIVLFDVKPLLKKYPSFLALQDEALFASVQIDGVGYGISWNDDLDFASEGIYIKGEHIGKTDPDLKILFGQGIAKSREDLGISQRQLSSSSGVMQAEISKIEQGKGNPTLTTMQKLAKSVGKSLASLLA